MKESQKHGRKKHPEQHRTYGEKRNRDNKIEFDEQLDSIDNENFDDINTTIPKPTKVQTNKSKGRCR